MMLISLVVNAVRNTKSVQNAKKTNTSRKCCPVYERDAIDRIMIIFVSVKIESQ
jgi:hypothetical protein